MKLILLILGSSLIILLLLFLLVGLLRTRKTQTSANQARFTAGKLPSPAPDGFYQGQVTGYNGPWQGKQFDAATQTGINIFATGDTTTEERYPFVTYVGKGLRDPSTDVLKIDYAKANNPWWVKFVLDEIVETEPGHYLGKI